MTHAPASCLLDPPAAVAALAGGLAFPAHACGVFRVRRAVDAWELRQYARLRRDVFCREQQLFAGTDVDAHDAGAVPIVAVSSAGVIDDEVVGAVRVYEDAPGVWYGSRLAVARDWRGVPSLATDLIRAAVRTAVGRGCHTFLATVQRQNVPLFRRLRWQAIGEVEVCGLPHQLMRASLGPVPT
jgi:putative N-acetyltransferase (TIGR04045 family)